MKYEICIAISWQAIGQSFLQSDIHVFRQNLESLETLNTKWKLYHKVSQRSVKTVLTSVGIFPVGCANSCQPSWVFNVLLMGQILKKDYCRLHVTDYSCIWCSDRKKSSTLYKWLYLNRSFYGIEKKSVFIQDSLWRISHVCVLLMYFKSVSKIWSV